MKKILLVLLSTVSLTYCMEMVDHVVVKPVPPVGLTNPDNACFMNATLQLLHATYDIGTILLENDTLGSEGGIIDLTRRAFDKIRQAEEPLHLEALHHILWNRLGVPQGQQGDANECLHILLTELTDTGINPEYKEFLLNYPGTNEKVTELSKLFFADMIHILSSPKDGYISSKPRELTIGLSLYVTGSETTLSDCLNRYFAGSTEYMKVNEDTLSEGTVIPFLHNTQNYLFFMLNRKKILKKDDGELVEERSENPLSFPLSNLNLQPHYLHKSNTKGDYELVGVIMHTGGHYITYSKIVDQWYYCNDEAISKITLEEMQAIAQQGYGTDKTMIPTTFVYELSSARPK